MSDDLRAKLETQQIGWAEAETTDIRLDDAERIAREHYEPLLEALAARNAVLLELVDALSDPRLRDDTPVGASARWRVERARKAVAQR